METSVAHMPPPQSLERVDPALLVEMLAHAIDGYMQTNDSVPLTVDAITRFHSRAPPSITPRQYLRRIVQYTGVENCCLLILLIYFERVAARGLAVSSLTVHRLIIASITVASKALCDNYYTNLHYAKVGGITLQELNTLELELLFLLDWQLTATNEALQECYVRLVNRWALSPAYACAAAQQPLPLPHSTTQPPQPAPHHHHHVPQQQQQQQSQQQQQQQQYPQQHQMQQMQHPQQAPRQQQPVQSRPPLQRQLPQPRPQSPAASPKPSAQQQGVPVVPHYAPYSTYGTRSSGGGIKRPLEADGDAIVPPPSPSSRVAASPSGVMAVTPLY